jgi:ABC-2 type transport system ATP-binding protein
MKRTTPKIQRLDAPRAIQVRGLSKTYKTGFWLTPKVTHALRDLHLDVLEGEAFGLLGLNGAGKTTALKLILGLLKPNTGSVQVLGGDISDRATRSRIGYLSELPYFSKQHTGKELLEYFGSLHGLGGKALSRRVDEVLELVGMARAAKDRLASYSKGMTQRIGVGQALIGRPALLVCDEPMSGLDPVGYKEMRDIFLELKKQGTTIFLNTHIMDEVERVCDRIGILHEGVLKETAEVADVLKSSVPVDYWIDVDKSYALKFAGLPFKGAVERQGGVQVTGLVLAETLALMTSRRAKVNSVRPLSSVIEAYFLRAIGAQGRFARAEGARS